MSDNGNKIISTIKETIRVEDDPKSAEFERGVGILNSIKIVINVIYALLIFQLFLILPRPEDPELQSISLNQLFADNLLTLLVMGIGIILILIYWIQFNRQMGNLVRSSPIHASIAILQMICLMLYLYFLRFDVEFDGLILALQMESIFLALAGFLGVLNWKYARYNKLTSDKINDKEEKDLFYSLLPEPITSLFTLPFAQYGADVWTIAFLAIIPIGMLLKWIRNRKN